MAMPDAFTPDIFTLTEMTASINKQPFIPGFLGRLGLFEERGLTGTTCMVEEKNGVLNLLPTQPRGGPRTGRQRQRRKVRNFTAPHIPVYDYIQADELVGVREFGTENQYTSLESVRDDRLRSMANDLDVTLEYHRMGAVKGVVYDADGTTVIYNMYDEFQISQPAQVAFDLSNGSASSGAVRRTIGNAIRTMAEGLGGATPAGFVNLCGDEFFDDLIANKEVRDTYKYQQGAQQREGYVWQQLDYGGMRHINLRNAAEFSLIATDECHMFPIGVPGMFITRFAPANYFETVNTVGLPRYAKSISDDWNTQVEIEAQTNPLNLCTRPLALLSGKRGS